MQPLCYSTKIPSLSHLLTWNSIFNLNITQPSDHYHLCLLYRPLLTFMQYTTAVQSTSQIIISGHHERRRWNLPVEPRLRQLTALRGDTRWRTYVSSTKAAAVAETSLKS